ncbi:lantibiotic dehydratase [Desmospora activa]|uniref:Lantibiotic biosynthesis dehydratase-like protein n=1 Tax=Desmospora activa DSM 45169 TaxID=1121389 RepID=A0A2T4Z7W4_9BACL|nr:lantibiotic dehydratase [Desmospora activa]PTM57988.1 lantibiotic biosynthesis dehydratase-like protein [Desmospora activa DSM 45169]
MNQLFSRPVVRLSPVPINTLDRLVLKNTLYVYQERKALYSRMIHLSNSICSELYQEIKKEKDPKRKKRLLKWKRKIGLIKKVEQTEEDADVYTAILKKWNKQLNEIDRLDQILKQTFEWEWEEKRRTLQELAGIPELMRAIALTNTDLIDKWEKYKSIPVDQQNKKMRKIERTVTMLLTRMIAKTSPFSSLTLVGEGQWRDEFKITSLSWYFTKEFNHSVSEYLWSILVDRLKYYVPLKINPFLTVKNNYMHYVMIDQQIHQWKFIVQKEKKVSLPIQPSLAKVFQSFMEKDLMSIEEFSRLTIENGSMEEREKIHQYLNKLIKLQILNVHSPFNEKNSDFLSQIIDALSQTQKKYFIDINYVIRRVKKMRELIQKSDIVTTLQELKQEWESLVDHLEINGGMTPNSESFFYENCYLNQPVWLPKTNFEEFSENISDLESMLVLFDSQIPFKLLIREIFIEMYGKDGVCDDLYSFQNVVEKVTRNSNLRKEYLGRIDDYKTWISLRNKLMEWIADHLQDDIEIDPSILREIHHELSDTLIQFQPQSWSYFIQPSSNSFVVNRISDGYGRFINRFMQQLSKVSQFSYSNEVRRIIKELDKDVIYAEISGVFGFNANVHPEITEYEYVYSGTNCNKVLEKQIHLEELSLRYDSKKDQLYFFSKKKGKKVCLLYLKTLNLGLVPPMFRFLIYLTQIFNPRLVFHDYLYDFLEKGPVMKLPRIRLGNIVLQRQQWWVDKEAFMNEFEKGLGDKLNKFIQFRDWIEHNNLPDKFYLQSNPRFQHVSEKYQDGMRKPQYIDSRSFHMVQVLFNQIQVMHEGFILEEALPNEDLPLQVNGEGHMCELLIEIYRKKEGN